MKKIFLLVLIAFTLMGCEKNKENNVVNDLTKKIEKTSSYKLTGNLSLFDNEDDYKYKVDVEYLKDDYYYVKMTNISTNHEQIILKNDDGLYVITPSLNRSFKFDSIWPNNSSQIYILSSLLKDMKNDETTIEKVDNNYIIKTPVKYPNNPELLYEKIVLDNNSNIEGIKVYDKTDTLRMDLQISEINYNYKAKKDSFKLENYIETSDCENDECKKEGAVSKIENAIYPIYVPDNTYLSSSEIIDENEENRIILTFSGSKNYVLVEENAIPMVNHEIIPMYGDPVLINDSIGALSTNSIYWTSNNVDYYLASSDLTGEEMVNIAASLTNSKVAMYTK